MKMILTDDAIHSIRKMTYGTDFEADDIEIEFARAIEAAIIEKLIQSLELYDVQSSNIWRHFYPNVKGTFIKLEELKEKLK